MQFKAILLMLAYISFASSFNESSFLSNFKLNSLEKWDNLSQHLVQMMLNSDDGIKGQVDAVILFIELGNARLKYDGFDETLAKYSKGHLVMRKDTKFILKLLDNGRNNFMIFLVNDLIANYQSIIQDYFRRVFLDKTLKIFLIVSDSRDKRNAKLIWNMLTLLKYCNVYIIFHESTGEFSIYRTAIERSSRQALNFIMRESKDQKFLENKDAIDTSTLPLRIIYFYSYPMSYLRNGTIVGADGNLIYEFSKKLNTSVLIVNNQLTRPALSNIYKYLDTTAEISININSVIYTENVVNVWLNTRDGMCLLVPKNIPITAFENYIMPMDKPSLILAFVSTVLVIITWIKITDEMSISSILFAVYELILNLGASGIEELTLRENFLVYCFIFSSFILVSSYESIILSLMLMEPSFRSAYDLQELNESNAKFYSFYTSNFAKLGHLPHVRDDLIMNYLSPDDSSLPAFLPDYFDVNLVYLVNCKYAEAFIHSSRNYRDNNQLFEKMTITHMRQCYSISTGFFYIDKFKDFVGRLVEAGIYRLWERQTLEIVLNKENSNKMTQDDIIGFDGMYVPIILLLIGSLIALMTFLIENVVYRWQNWRNNKVNVQSMVRWKKKLKLDSWKQKFIYGRISNTKCEMMQSKERTRSLEFKIGRKEFISCRESISGGYFVLKKFKTTKKSRKIKRRIIKVKPFEMKP